MASSTQIKALMQSHIDKDDDRFLSIALQVAAHEARSGHGRIAQELRDIVENAKRKNFNNIQNCNIPKGIENCANELITSRIKHFL